MAGFISVIGLGSIATRHRKNLKQLYPEAKIVAMSSSGRVPVEDIPDADLIVAKISEVIELGPTFVIVASPAPFHLTYTEPLLCAGIPVLVEKPVTASYKDALKMTSTMERTNTAVAVGYCIRYMPSALKLNELLMERVVGTVINVYVNVGQYLPGWRKDKDYRQSVSVNPSLGGGVLLELSHELDYLQWFFGKLSVDHVLLRNSTELDLAVEEVADVMLRNNEGVAVSLHMDFLQKNTQRLCSVVGTSGRLDWDLISNSVTYHGEEGGSTLFSDSDWDRNEMYLSMLKDFQSRILGEENRCVDLIEASSTVSLIENIKANAIWGDKI